MSMKMSEAVEVVNLYNVFENENVCEAAEKPVFKVITTTDLKNPFTFNDEGDTLSHKITKLQVKHIVALCLIVLAISAAFVLIQNMMHTSRASELIENSAMSEVVVMPGDTLWDIAEEKSHGKMSVSEFVYYITEINHLESSALSSGQVLSVPEL